MLRKTNFIKHYKPNDEIDDIFFVKFKHGIKEYKNGYSFELILADSSGNIKFKLWGDRNREAVEKLYSSIKPDDIVHVKGRISEYNNALQLSSSSLSDVEILRKGQYIDDDFIKPPKKDIEVMFGKLMETIEGVSSPSLRKLLLSIFNDNYISKAFKRHPAAIEVHHNWIGGLLEHTLEVVGYCLKTAEMFPSLDKDLMVAGALLHDIGKLKELAMTSRIKGTKGGQLKGHIVEGAVLVSNKCDEAGVDGETKDKLLHIIISHHGKEEFGSPKPPMFPEALAVACADEFSAKMAEMIDFISSSRTSTEDDFMYDRRLQRNIYLK